MPNVGEVVCIILGEKKRQKDNWIPGLVVAPTAQDTCKIKVATEALVRSFQDGRYYTVPKKEMQPFTKEVGEKADTNTLKAAVEKAFSYLDKDELPPHWDRDVLFGRDMVSDRDSSDEDVSFIFQFLRYLRIDDSGLFVRT
jgi:Ras-related protein Rab-1A